MMSVSSWFAHLKWKNILRILDVFILFYYKCKNTHFLWLFFVETLKQNLNRYVRYIYLSGLNILEKFVMKTTTKATKTTCKCCNFSTAMPLPIIIENVKFTQNESFKFTSFCRWSFFTRISNTNETIIFRYLSTLDR